MEVIGRFTFDSENGLGSIPWNSNITYLGFIVYMKPGEFLRLNPPRNDHKSLNELKDYIIHNDVSIGPPLLEVKWDEDNSRWQVFRHEGRGRMTAVESVQPDHLVPVHVVPRGMRARHVTPTMAQAYFMPDRKSWTNWKRLTTVMTGA